MVEVASAAIRTIDHTAILIADTVKDLGVLWHGNPNRRGVLCAGLSSITQERQLPAGASPAN